MTAWRCELLPCSISSWPVSALFSSPTCPPVLLEPVVCRCPSPAVVYGVLELLLCPALGGPHHPPSPGSSLGPCPTGLPAFPVHFLSCEWRLIIHRPPVTTRRLPPQGPILTRHNRTIWPTWTPQTHSVLWPVMAAPGEPWTSASCAAGEQRCHQPGWGRPCSSGPCPVPLASSRHYTRTTRGSCSRPRAAPWGPRKVPWVRPTMSQSLPWRGKEELSHRAAARKGCGLGWGHELPSGLCHILLR